MTDQTNVKPSSSGLSSDLVRDVVAELLRSAGFSSLVTSVTHRVAEARTTRDAGIPTRMVASSQALDVRLNEIVKTLKHLTVEVGGVRTQVAEVRAKVDKLDRELVEVTDRQKGFEDSLAKLAAQQTEMREELGELRVRQKGFEDSIKNLQTEMREELRQELQGIERRVRREELNERASRIQRSGAFQFGEADVTRMGQHTWEDHNDIRPRHRYGR